MPQPISQRRQRNRHQPFFKPTVILHGGAGNIQRSRLPPELYNQYRNSLLTYLRSTTALLNADLEDAVPPRNNIENDAVNNNTNTSTASAVNAAVHAVSLMEDDELFNCGRGSVFTSAGTIEMEASIMVASLLDDDDDDDDDDEIQGLASERTPGSIKRGAGVMLVRNVRHPIQLAREVLLRTGYANDGDGDGYGDGGNMHSQLSGEYVEGLAREWGLEFCPDDWFWTKKRWEEHQRGLKKGRSKGGMIHGGGVGIDVEMTGDSEGDHGYDLYLSQGTVGCVCLDRWGNIAVATSTGGLTNKCPGRIGDTPTLGAGFWAEAWDVEGVEGLTIDGGNVDNVRPGGSNGLGFGSQSSSQPRRHMMIYQGQDATPIPLSSQSGSTTTTTPTPIPTLPGGSPWQSDINTAFNIFRDCFSPSPRPLGYAALEPSRYPIEKVPMTNTVYSPYTLSVPDRRRILALSGTGNGDSFLRIAATRTAAAMARFAQKPVSLAQAVTAVAGPGGELQRSAGRRWGKTGEGEGGIIGIEAEVETDGRRGGERTLRRGKVVFDFNSMGMFRAWMEERDGRDVERMMVFRDEYE